MYVLVQRALKRQSRAVRRAERRYVKAALHGRLEREQDRSGLFFLYHTLHKEIPLWWALDHATHQYILAWLAYQRAVREDDPRWRVHLPRCIFSLTPKVQKLITEAVEAAWMRVEGKPLGRI